MCFYKASQLQTFKRKTFLIEIGFSLISIKDMTVYGMTCLETTVNVICNYMNNIEMKLN